MKRLGFFHVEDILLLTFEIGFYCSNTHSDSCLVLDILLLLLLCHVY